MSERQIKEYYERIEKLLNGANKETYGFAPQEIKNILRSYEELQNQNQELKKQLDGIIEERDYLFNKLNTENKWLIVGNKKLRKKLEVGEEQYNDLVEEKEELQEQLSIKTLQLEEIKISKRDYTQENILEMKLTLKENQQKEFINYMMNTIENITHDETDDEEIKGYLIQRGNTFKEILSKYKSIIGGNNGI